MHVDMIRRYTLVFIMCFVVLKLSIIEYTKDETPQTAIANEDEWYSQNEKTNLRTQFDFKILSEESATCTQQNCRLSTCFCPGVNGPPDIQPKSIPQMVMLTFDDAVNDNIYNYVEQLSDHPRMNPNGCPVSFTFYLSDTWSFRVGDNKTDYTLVRMLYDAGHEIASHGISHRFPSEWWRTTATLEDYYEFSDQRDNIHAKTGIPKSDIKGMRIPFLKQGGDKPFIMMKDVGMVYDATAVARFVPNGGVWPYTMDYPPGRTFCLKDNCPTSAFPGMWEVPLNQWETVDGRKCGMADSCRPPIKGYNTTLVYVCHNFDRFFKQNRAPFGIHIHARWFEDDRTNIRVLKDFLDGITTQHEVYLVSPSQILDWMRHPTTLNDIKTFTPWQNTCNRSRQRSTKRT